jgi:TP901-1 family phage major tail protein
MASTVFNGSNLLIKVADDGSSPTTIGHSTSCTISFTNDMADATTKDSSGFSEVIAGLRSAEISFDGLIDYTDGSSGGAEIAHKLLTRQKVDFSFGTAATGDTVYTGEGFISSCEISGSMEEAVTYSGTITVTGAITESVN